MSKLKTEEKLKEKYLAENRDIGHLLDLDNKPLWGHILKMEDDLAASQARVRELEDIAGGGLFHLRTLCEQLNDGGGYVEDHENAKTYLKKHDALLPRWKKEDIEKAKKEGKKLANYFNSKSTRQTEGQ